MIRYTKADPNFSAIRYVLRARDAKAIQPAFTGLYSDGVNIVCSDSRRLAFSPVVMPFGLFEVIKDTASEIILGEQIDGQFPDYKKVVPEVADAPLIRLRGVNKISSASSALYWIALAGACVNYSYIDDALKDTEYADAYVTGEISPCVIKTNLGTHIIMPIQVKK